MISLRRTLVAAVSAVVLVAGLGYFGASTATAAEGALLECPGFETSYYSPGMTLLPRDIEVHSSASYSTCGATSELNGTVPNASCANVLLPQVTERLQWQSGPQGTSVIEYTTAASARVVQGTLVTLFGQVVAGRYDGSTATKQVLVVTTGQLATACLTQEGVTSSQGPVNLIIL